MALLKKRNRPLALLIFLLFLVFLSVAYGQEEMLLLDDPDAYIEKQRPAVEFPHELHMGVVDDCLDCHHDYNEKKENVLDDTLLEEGNEEIYCASCHDASTDIDLKKAFHRQCMGCHRDLRRSGEETGPELCGECHKKK